MNKLFNEVSKFFKRNSTTILSGGAAVGVAGTAYLSARGGFRSSELIGKEVSRRLDEEKESNHFSRKDVIKLVWKEYIPAAIVGTITVGCIVGSNRMGSRKVLAATMAYSITEQAFAQYKEKIVEQLGEKKERDIRDDIARDKISNLPPPPRETRELAVVGGPQGVLCCEMYTGRFFMSDMETLRRAENDLNARLLRHDRCNLNDFYYAVGLSQTQYSYDIGWTSEKLLELKFHSVIAEDGRPCLAFDYNYVRPLD